MQLFWVIPPHKLALPPVQVLLVVAPPPQVLVCPVRQQRFESPPVQTLASYPLHVLVAPEFPQLFGAAAEQSLLVSGGGGMLMGHDRCVCCWPCICARIPWAQLAMMAARTILRLIGRSGAITTAAIGETLLRLVTMPTSLPCIVVALRSSVGFAVFCPQRAPDGGSRGLEPYLRAPLRRDRELRS